MRTFLSLLLCLWATVGLLAQKAIELRDNQKTIDSINRVIASATSDSLRCVGYFELSRNYIGDDLELVKQNLTKANALIKGNDYLKAISYCYNGAYQFYTTKNLDTYIDNLSLAKERLQRYKNPEAQLIRLKTLMNLAVVYGWKEEVSKATRIQIEEAIPLAKQLQNNEMLGVLYTSLSKTFFNRNDLNKARYYSYQSIKTIEARKLNSKQYFENLFIAYLNEAEIQASLTEHDKAKAVMRQCYAILKNHPQSNLWINYFYTKSFCEWKAGHAESALSFVNQGLGKAKEDQDDFLQYKLVLLKIQILSIIHHWAEAKALLIEVLQSPYQQADEKRDNHKQLARVYKQLKDFKNSVLQYKSYIRLRDSLDKDQQDKIVANLEARYQQSETQSKIKQLETQKQKALLLAKYNRLHYIVFGLISLLLLLATFFLAKNAKSLKRIAWQKEINYQQNLKTLKFQKELEVMQATIYGEEAERKRIARDLHDGIGSRLSAMKMQLQSLASVDHANSNWKDISDSLSVSIIELRQIAFNLLPETLTKLGLELALKDLCHWLSSEKCLVTFQGHEISSQMTAQNQLAIFRIVQELVTNALKHSQATEIIVDCSQNDQLFLITVEDNGMGFNLQAVEGSGLGIKNIKNRVELLKGNLEIISNPRQGSIFNISIILSQDAN